MGHLLSKSKYIRGLQCERALWLDVHEPRLARYTAEQMRRFDRGRDFEYAFKSRFPDGIALSETYRRDAALQHYVISHCRRVNSFSIVYNGLDGANGQGGQDGRFAIVDLTAELAAEGDRIAANIADMKTIVRATAEPDTPTGQPCLTPYACPYQHHCQQGIRQLSLFG